MFMCVHVSAQDNVALALQLEDIQRDIEKAQSDKKYELINQSALAIIVT